MKLDDALKKAFNREVAAVPERRPDSGELVRACNVNQAGYRRAAGFRRVSSFNAADLIPVLSLAAAALLVMFLDPAYLMPLRPFASNLVASIPDEAGSRFLDFVLEAGESYRSFN